MGEFSVAEEGHQPLPLDRDFAPIAQIVYTLGAESFSGSREFGIDSKARATSFEARGVHGVHSSNSVLLKRARKKLSRLFSPTG
jgi:hypothetical protein